MKKVTINLSNRLTYTLVAVLVLVVVVGIINAFGTSNPEYFGHTAGEISGLEGIGGGGMTYKKLSSPLIKTDNAGGTHDYTFSLGDFNDAGAGLTDFDEITAYDIFFYVKADADSSGPVTELYVHDGSDYKKRYRLRIGDNDNIHQGTSLVIPREEANQLRARIINSRNQYEISFEIRGVYVGGGSGGGSSGGSSGPLSCVIARADENPSDAPVLISGENIDIGSLNVNDIVTMKYNGVGLIEDTGMNPADLFGVSCNSGWTMTGCAHIGIGEGDSDVMLSNNGCYAHENDGSADNNLVDIVCCKGGGEYKVGDAVFCNAISGNGGTMPNPPCTSASPTTCSTGWIATNCQGSSGNDCCIKVN